VNDIAKGILGGGWSLVAGWILPTTINVLLFGFLVLPSVHRGPLVDDVLRASATQQSFVAFGGSVVIGLVLSALQTPLYRLLEGYLLWPAALAQKSRSRQLRRKKLLEDRLEAIHLRSLQLQGNLVELEDKKRLEELAADPRVKHFAHRDEKLTTVQQALLRERLRRYPVSDAQVAPTRLGNAIRRLEEYGYQRYRLDSQALWYELTATAPTQLRQQVDLARAGVDFFVCLLYGNLVVAVTALASLSAYGRHYIHLLLTAIVMILLARLWYRLAEVASDDWAIAVRALVDVGRKALAESLGLLIPKELIREREMWRSYSRFVRRPYDDSSAATLDEFRMSEDTKRHTS
jgi:hypothetical protein